LGRVNLLQPDLGLAGLLLAVPASLLLAVGAGGAEPGLHTLGPIVTFALPAVSMIAFWWDRWPGSLLQPMWTLVAVGAFAPVLYMSLAAYAGTLDWTETDPHDWIAHAELNAISISVMTHVVIGRRWPFVPFDLDVAAN
jgi:hypothetical protein